jgi:transposase
MDITRCGLDIAKQVFQVHMANERGVVRGRKTLPRARVLEYFAQLPPCLIGMEACGGAHYWGRELSKLGHTVKLMAAQFVIPYRKRGKNDVNDAEAICEAVGRPNMHFVAVKTEEQQAVLMVHRARSLVMSNRTALSNQIRGVLGEFGLVFAKGVSRLRAQLPQILEDAENNLPALAREVLAGLLEQFHELDQRIQQYDGKIRELAQQSDPARRLMRLESIGPMTATAIVAGMGDPHVFKSGRNYAASLGLAPRQDFERREDSPGSNHQAG